MVFTVECTFSAECKVKDLYSEVTVTFCFEVLED